MANGCFVTTIDLKLAEKMRDDLLSQGFELSTPPYTIFSAKKKGVSCTLFTSGKLTVQGKDQEEFISFYLEPEILGQLSYTHPETMVDLKARIGIDEAGKGDFFGPLCIAGVYADEPLIKKLLELGVRDSKKLSDATIRTLATKIRSHVPHSLVQLFPRKYNELYEKFKNLNRLLAWGHATAIEELAQNTGCHRVIIDQFGAESLVIDALKRKKLEIDLTQRHYGEEDPVVAAASILARCAFLDGLEQLGKSIGVVLPKGAANHVKEMGRKLYAKQGPDLLQTVAKVHFKTYQEIVDAEGTHS